MYESDDATAESGIDFDVNENTGDRPDAADANGEMSAEIDGAVDELLDRL